MFPNLNFLFSIILYKYYIKLILIVFKNVINPILKEKGCREFVS